MGIQELIAQSEEDFVRIATSLLTNNGLRESVEGKICGSLPKVFRNGAAVDEWATLLSTITRNDTVTELGGGIHFSATA